MAQRIPMKKKWLIAAVLFIVCALAATSCEKKDTDVVGTITPENVESGETVTSSFDYETSDLTPYVTLGNYEGLHGTLAIETITEAKLDTELDALAEQYGHYNEITDRDTVEEGDRVVADYAGTKDGVAFEGGTATEQEIVVTSDSGYIPGFAEAFVGQKVGEEFSFDVTFPNTRRSEFYHRVGVAVPAVEIAGKADPPGRRRVNGKKPCVSLRQITAAEITVSVLEPSRRVFLRGADKLRANVHETASLHI